MGRAKVGMVRQEVEESDEDDLEVLDAEGLGHPPFRALDVARGLCAILGVSEWGWGEIRTYEGLDIVLGVVDCEERNDVILRRDLPRLQQRQQLGKEVIADIITRILFPSSANLLKTQTHHEKHT